MKKLYEQTDLFIFDLDGTIYMGATPIKGAIELLQELERDNKKIAFVTNNSSRARKDYIRKLSLMGYTPQLEQIITSTMATAEYLLENHPQAKIYAVGNQAFIKELREYGITIIENDYDDVDIVLLAFDTSISYAKLYRASVLLQRGKIYIATHPDITCPYGDTLMPDVGSFMALLQAVNGRAPSVICGKPYPPLAKVVSKAFDTPPDRITMVGDRLYTDIRFGVDNGYHSILVLTGETTLEMASRSEIKPTITLQSVRDIKKENN